MKREPGLDYIRVIATLIIIGFHFGCYSASTTPLFMNYANGSLPVTSVGLFFMLSGACLYLNYGGKALRLKTFYFKRWKGMLVPFYLVFAFCFLYKGMINGNLFYIREASPWSLLLSACGMDGYLLYRIPSYYSIGEWFLGAIVLLYLCYPIVQWAVDRAWWAVQLAVTALFGGVIWLVDTGAYANYFTIEWPRNLAVCLFSFVTGISLMRNAKYLKKIYVFIPLLVLLVVLLFVRIPGLPSVVNWFVAAVAFAVLLDLGSYLGEGGVYPLIRKLSELTFGMYLVHHVLIVFIVPGWNPSDPGMALTTYAAVVLLTLIFSKMLSVVVDAVYKSRPFRWLEKYCTGR